MGVIFKSLGLRWLRYNRDERTSLLLVCQYFKEEISHLLIRDLYVEGQRDRLLDFRSQPRFDVIKFNDAVKFTKQCTIHWQKQVEDDGRVVRSQWIDFAQYQEDRAIHIENEKMNARVRTLLRRCDQLLNLQTLELVNLPLILLNLIPAIPPQVEHLAVYRETEIQDDGDFYYNDSQWLETMTLSNIRLTSLRTDNLDLLCRLVQLHCATLQVLEIDGVFRETGSFSVVNSQIRQCIALRHLGFPLENERNHPWQPMPMRALLLPIVPMLALLTTVTLPWTLMADAAAFLGPLDRVNVLGLRSNLRYDSERYPESWEETTLIFLLRLRRSWRCTRLSFSFFKLLKNRGLKSQDRFINGREYQEYRVSDLEDSFHAWPSSVEAGTIGMDSKAVIIAEECQWEHD